MTGLGSPCGACKFLRRKCIRGCVFAPYFCNEQGAAHFAAIHKVFGASNFSKLLSLLPAADRPDAAATVSYEAQARLHDPVYGCVAHVFALQQRVLNLQAQLAALKAQVGGGQNGGAHPADKMSQWQQGDQGGFFQAVPRPSVNASSVDCRKNCQQGGVEGLEEDVSFAMAAASALELQAGTWSSAYHTMEDLQSQSLAYQLRH